jgi:hypothetical protein
MPARGRSIPSSICSSPVKWIAQKDVIRRKVRAGWGRVTPNHSAHESPRTTKLSDRTGDEITLDQVERMRFEQQSFSGTRSAAPNCQRLFVTIVVQRKTASTRNPIPPYASNMSSPASSKYRRARKEGGSGPLSGAFR